MRDEYLRKNDKGRENMTKNRPLDCWEFDPAKEINHKINNNNFKSRICLGYKLQIREKDLDIQCIAPVDSRFGLETHSLENIIANDGHNLAIMENNTFNQGYFCAIKSRSFCEVSK